MGTSTRRSEGIAWSDRSAAERLYHQGNGGRYAAPAHDATLNTQPRSHFFGGHRPAAASSITFFRVFLWHSLSSAQ